MADEMPKIELPKTKLELQALRAALIADIPRATSTKERMGLQLRLSEVNAAIKHLNKVQAADDKHAADVRKALGQREYQANEKRHEEGQSGHARGGPDEEVLVKAKMLLKELTRYPPPKPAHFDSAIEMLNNLIEVHKAKLKGQAKTESERDSWYETWQSTSK